MPKFQGREIKKLAILGGGGHARVVSDTAECLGWESIEFFDDMWPNIQNIGKWPVSGDTNSLLKNIHEFHGVVVAIGDNDVRLSKINELNVAGAAFTSLIHPAATVSANARIGHGVVAFAGAVVNTGAVIGDGTILNTGCSVDHDCFLGECVHISPGARLAGAVNIGCCTWIGIGACVKQAISIGSRVKVGAGAAVVNHVVSGITVVGVPAKPLFFD
ncbi:MULTISPECIES: acetyltransferase [unclassified Pseudomonas]|uniref:acetyltransferase n=1 Tax=unclassified Pseudomonas TaxID=196821 RepID=UPI0021CCEC93|nr:MULTISPECIES: acetyltransferase [unclassified Pseudomonas]